MDDYKAMYYKLFNKMTDIALEIQRVQQETEDMFIEQGKRSDGEATLTYPGARQAADREY